MLQFYITRNFVKITRVFNAQERKTIQILVSCITEI